MNITGNEGSPNGGCRDPGGGGVGGHLRVSLGGAVRERAPPQGVPTLAPTTKATPRDEIRAPWPPASVTHPRGSVNHPPGASWGRGGRPGSPSSHAAILTLAVSPTVVLRWESGVLPESPAKPIRGRHLAPRRSCDKERPRPPRAPYGVHLRLQGCHGQKCIN